MAAHRKIMACDTLSAHKVLEFVRLFPDVLPGKKRGNFEHVRFAEIYGSMTFSGEQSWGKFMCFIEFSRKMERKYGWTVQQCRVKWEFWKSKNVASDMNGKVDGWPERMMIPKGDYSVAGSQFQHAKEMIAESKKSKSITEGDFAQRVCSASSRWPRFACRVGCLPHEYMHLKRASYYVANK